jgi:DNA-binding NtrC family response regulator
LGEAIVNKTRVLIVDDDPAWLEELVPLLSNAGYDVETASSFDTARDKLALGVYAVTIIDLELGGNGVPQAFEGLGLLSGLQFLEEITHRPCKTVVLSAYGTNENIRQAFKRGAYDFIEKQSFDQDEFLEIVRDAEEQWHSSRPVVPPRELTPEEKKEYDRVTRRFLQGKPILFNIPDDAINPWSKEP